MSTEDVNAFLKALDVVKQDYKCGECGELCKDPITLSVCFHLICKEHFENLTACPVCETSLEGCSMFTDDRLQKCIDSTKELDKIFEKFQVADLRPVKSVNTAVKEGSKKVKKDNKSKEKATKMDLDIEEVKSNTRAKKVSENIPKEKATKSDLDIEEIKSNTSAKKISKNILSDKTNKATKHDMNLSLMSSGNTAKTNEKRNTKGETMLHIACRLGKIDRVTELLNQGANTNTKDNAGWTPLHEVVQNGNLELVTLLLQYNTLINVPGASNETPLHEAVRYNRAEIAKVLIQNGADIHARNCKAETPIQLAGAEMKKVLMDASKNVIHTQTVNITHMSELYSELDFDDIRVYCVSEQKSVQNKLKLLLKQHSNLNVEVKFTKRVTHLIVDTDNDYVCTSSLDVLQGIVSSIWILSSNWVLDSTAKKLESFEQYEVTGVGSKDYNGPKMSRYNKYKQLPGIFNGCHMYLHNFNIKYEISKSIVVTKAILTKLIMDAGGIVLRRVPNPESIPESEKLVPYHAKKDGKLSNCAHYIIFKDIYEPMYNMQHLKALPVGWLIECIEKYELCEPIPYNF